MIMTTHPSKKTEYAVCIENTGFTVSLEINKIYCVLPDEDAAVDGDIRVITKVVKIISTRQNGSFPSIYHL